MIKTIIGIVISGLLVFLLLVGVSFFVGEKITWGIIIAINIWAWREDLLKGLNYLFKRLVRIRLIKDPWNRFLDWHFKCDYKNKNQTWRCPCCKRKLAKGEDKEYETLSDHVYDPNMEKYPLRATWECQNVKCSVANSIRFYDQDGAVHSTTDTPKKYWSAIGSPDWSFYRKNKWEV